MLSGVTLGPIKAVSGVGACFATLDNQERPVAVMLDFVDPPRTRRRVIDYRCELRLDELKRHPSDLAEAGEIASPLTYGVEVLDDGLRVGKPKRR